MSLPNQIDPTVPTSTEALSLGDDRIRALSLAITDIFGIPVATNIASALGSVTAAGLKNWLFQNAAANPTSAGQVQRNATNLLFHDGTAARKILTDATGAVNLAGVLSGNLAGDYVTSQPAYVNVDATNLLANITIPVGARFFITAISFVATWGSIADATNKVQVLLGAVGTAGCFNSNTNSGVFLNNTAYGVITSPASGATTVSLQFRNVQSGTTTIRNSASEGAGQRVFLLYLVVM
jgi:hypothetical protein